MTEQALAVVRRFNEGIECGDVDPELIDPAIEVVDHDLPDAGTYHGHDGMVKWIAEDWGSAWEKFTIRDTIVEDMGDVALSVFTLVATGKGSGIETSRRNATLASIVDGRLNRLEYFTTEEEARAAATANER
jgi:hypothetical protein